MKKIKKINIKNIRNNSSLNKCSLYNKDEEEVLKLNLGKFKDKYFKNKQIESNIEDKNSKKRSTITFLRSYTRTKSRKLSDFLKRKNSNYLENLEEEFSSLNDISKSIKKLQTIVPNLLDKINKNNSGQLLSAPRFQHIQYENHFHQLLKDLNKKEVIIKKNKELLENALSDIEETILDKQISMDILVNMDSFKKMHRQKVINHYEKEFNKIEQKKLELHNINNSIYINSEKNISNNVNKSYNISNNNEKILSSISSNTNRSSKLNNPIKDENLKSLKVQHILRVKAFRAQINNFLIKNKEKNNIEAQKLENEINDQKINKQLIIEDLNNINKKLKIIHINQKNIIDKLYIHYLTILKDGKDTREEGLAWVISEILNLGKKVMMSFFPKYLDEKCILYLFEMAHLLIKSKNLEKKFYELKKEFSPNQKLRTSLSEQMDLKNYLKTIKTLNSIKEKFLNTSDSSKRKSKIINNFNVKRNTNHPLSLRRRRSTVEFMSKVEKSKRYDSPIFVHGDPNHYYGDLNEEEIPNKIMSFKELDKYTLKTTNDLLKKHKDMKFEKCFDLLKEMDKLKKMKDDLKNKEMSRIFNEYRKNKYYERYNVDKNTLLKALVGEENLIMEIYNQNKKEKQLNDEILKTRLFKKQFFKKNVIYMKNNISNLEDDSFNIFKDNENFNTIANSEIKDSISFIRKL